MCLFLRIFFPVLQKYSWLQPKVPSVPTLFSIAALILCSAAADFRGPGVCNHEFSEQNKNCIWNSTDVVRIQFAKVPFLPPKVDLNLPKNKTQVLANNLKITCESRTLFIFYKLHLLFVCFLTLYPFLLFSLPHTLPTSPSFFFFTTSCCYFINDPSFSASLSATPALQFFPTLLSLFLFLSCFWLSAEHLSRVANHYPQSLHLNQRFFTLFLMCPPSLTLLLTVDASPALLTQAGLSSWHEY